MISRLKAAVRVGSHFVAVQVQVGSPTWSAVSSWLAAGALPTCNSNSQLELATRTLNSNWQLELATRTGNSNCHIAAISAFFPGLGRVKDTLAVSLTNGGGGVGDIEFFVDVFDVVGHRGDADAEALRDFFL